MGVQSCKSPNFGNPGTKWHLGAGPMAKHREYYKGEGGGFLQVQVMVSLVSPCFAHGESMHQKCSNYTLTNLLFGLCRSMWVIKLFINLFSPNHRAPTRPSTAEVLQAKECTLTPFVIFTFGLVVESIKELGGA
jgi:hypothetical protein